MNQKQELKKNHGAVGTIPDPDLIKSLITYLGDPKRDICKDAFNSLKNIGKPAVQPLVQALTNPVEKIRWEALKILEEMKVDWTPYADDKTIEALVGDLTSSNGFERMRARRALVFIGRRSAKALIQAFSSKEPLRRWEAAKALSQIGDPSATTALIDALTDKNFDIRWLAAEGLISIGRPALIPVLRHVVKNPESEWLREGVHHYLHEVNNEKLDKIIHPVLKALEDIEAELSVPLAAEKALNSLNK